MQSLADLEQSFHNTVRSNLPTHIKKQLLAGFAAELRVMQRNAPKLRNKANNKSALEGTDCTSKSHLSVLSTPSRLTVNQEIEEAIIEKQKEKVWLDQQIQLAEEDFFENEKVIFIKRDICHQLDSKISKIRYDRSKEEPKSNKKSISERFRTFFQL